MQTKTFDETQWKLVPTQAGYRSRLAAVIPLQELVTMFVSANNPRYVLFRDGATVFDSGINGKLPTLSEEAAKKTADKLYSLMLAATPEDHRNDEQIGAGEDLLHECPHHDWVMSNVTHGDKELVFWCPDPEHARTIRDILANRS